MQPITERTRNAYTEELEILKSSMDEKAERVVKARELGDLSENEEYAEAQKDLNMSQSRMLELEQILKSTKVVKDSGGPEIGIGSFIRVNDLDTNVEKLFILDSVERFIDGHLGIKSPLGKEILNGVSGIFSISTSDGNLKRYKVEKLNPNDEAVEKEFAETYTVRNIFDE